MAEEGIKVEAEGGELVLRNIFGDYAIIPKHSRGKVKELIAEECWSCIDDFVKDLPTYSDYAQEGSLYPSLEGNGGGEPKRVLKPGANPMFESSWEYVTQTEEETLAKNIKSAKEATKPTLTKVDPPPKKITPKYQTKPMGYYSTLKQPEVSDSIGASNPNTMDEEQYQLTLKNIEEKGDLIETIKRARPGITHQQAVENAEMILQSANRKQETARELTPEEKAQIYEIRRTGDISGAGDYWQRAKDIIWNPIDAFSYAMDDRVEMPLGLTEYKQLQREGLIPEDQVSSNSMMNTASMASYTLPTVGLLAAGKDIYESSSAFLEDPTLGKAVSMGITAAGARGYLGRPGKLSGRFARSKISSSDIGNTFKDAAGNYLKNTIGANDEEEFIEYKTTGWLKNY